MIARTRDGNRILQPDTPAAFPNWFKTSGEEWDGYGPREGDTVFCFPVGNGDQARAFAQRSNERLKSDPSELDAVHAEYTALVGSMVERSRQVQAVGREDYVRKSIPPEYRQCIDPAQIKNRRAFEKVQAWIPGLEAQRPGLMAWGRSGAGKTRAIYSRLAALHRAHGTGFIGITSDDLKNAILSLSAMQAPDEIGYGSGRLVADRLADISPMLAAVRSVESLIDGLRRASVLFIDDIGQAKMTPVYGERLFSLIEYRTARCLPVIVTAQIDGDALTKKLSGYENEHLDRAQCIVRRIRDKCCPVNFDSLME